MTRTRLRDPDAIRRRAEAMYRRKLAGDSMRRMAAEHRLTIRHVRRELARLNHDIRLAIEQAWRGAILAPGGWRVWPR